MTFPTRDIQSLLRQFQIRPNKRLGQHFLVDPVALDKVIEAADLKGDEAVLEVGPGVGNLTRLLAIQVKRVIAIELDSDLIPPLTKNIAACSNVEIIQGDILRIDISTLFPDSNYIVVSNIPYNITSALIRYLLETPHPAKRLVLTIQEEVATRIVASPGNMSILALSVQVYGVPVIKANIPAAAFYPPPKINSAVVCVDRYPEPRIPEKLLPAFFQIIKAGFSQKRKTISNSLSGGMGWEVDYTKRILHETGIDPKSRPQTLSIEEWAFIAKTIDAQHKIEPKVTNK